MANDNRVVSFIDVGTNSIHILVVKFFGDSMGTPIFQDKESVRLGQHLFRHGFIDAETIKKARIVLSNFVRKSKDLGAEEIFTYATCAAREASNRKELLDAVKMEGLNVKVISGLEEARLIKLGIFGPEGPRKRTLEIDIGGGSTEIVVCEGKNDIFMDTLDLGCVRLAYGPGQEQNEAMSMSEYEALRRHISLMAYRTCRMVSTAGFHEAYGSSGTMMALAEMCAATREDGDSSYMMYYELAELMKKLYSKDIEKRKSVPGMNPARADIIVSGGAIAEVLMNLLNIDRIEISPNGLKQGMEIDYLLRKGHSNFDVRGSSVQNLAARCLFDKTHAETVQRNALLLFDKMKEFGMHDMEEDMRTLLSYASTLHDIGEFISYPKHHLHSYTIILNSFLPGFSNEELQIMALIAKYHHKGLPSRSMKVLKEMDSNVAKDVLRCIVILKIADILDRHRNSAVDYIEISVKSGKMMISLGSETDISMEVWKLNTIKSDFKTVFGRDLLIDRS